MLGQLPMCVSNVGMEASRQPRQPQQPRYCLKFSTMVALQTKKKSNPTGTNARVVLMVKATSHNSARKRNVPAQIKFNRSVFG